jgi:hypothetical protein
VADDDGEIEAGSPATRAWTVLESLGAALACTATRTTAVPPDTVRIPKSVSADAAVEADKSANPIANRFISKPPLVYFPYIVGLAPTTALGAKRFSGRDTLTFNTTGAEVGYGF